MANPADIVVITGLSPLFKEGVEANSIQLARFGLPGGTECGFSVVVQKGAYSPGDEAVYIQPDYCVPDGGLFASFTAPGGDPKKSRLGRQNRVRATRFNFSDGNGHGPVYSNGILLPLADVESCIGDAKSGDLAGRLGVFKYEEPETAGSGLAGDFPTFLYKTDEENICNIVDHVRWVLSKGESLGVSVKRDGSSITVYFKKGLDGDYVSGVCSRSQEKKADQHYTAWYVDFAGRKYRRKRLDSGEQGWLCDENGDFRSEGELSGLTAVIREHRDSWLELARSSGLLERGLEYCRTNGLELAFRGEIIGQGLNGSGNRFNPDSSLQQRLVLFGVDDLSDGYSRRVNYSSVHNLKAVAEAIGVEYTPVSEVSISTYEGLCEYCEGVFASEKAAGRIIEGVVIRTMYSNELSCKYMNFEYDSRK